MTEEDEKYDGVVVWYNERKDMALFALIRMKFFTSFSVNLIWAGTVYPGAHYLYIWQKMMCPVIQEIWL